MLSLLLRNLFFTILQPGLVAGLAPYYLLRYSKDFQQSISWSWVQYVGIFVGAMGFVIMMKCILDFAFKGKGTISPADPTQKLVVQGLYKYTRNPMYVGVIGLLIGEAIFFESISLLIYTILVLLLFHLFIKFVEEPRLRKDFGDEYKIYCDSVKRWI